MNSEERNQNLYKRTFDEVHAPADLLGKVRSMKKDKKSRVRYCARRIAVAVAALAVVFVSSNVITYAATGASWISGLAVIIDGQSYQIEDFRSTVEEGGTVYEFEIQGPENTENSYYMIQSQDTLKVITLDEAAGIYARLEQGDDGMVYLTAGDARVNVTEELADGICEGDVSVGGSMYHYVVSENEEEYSVRMNACEE